MAIEEDDFETLYLDERPRLTRASARIAGDAAEDVVQDAFIRLLSHREDVVAPRAWLSQVARNKALNDLRHRSVPLEQDLAGEQAPVRVERDALRTVVAEALADLDPRSREALRLRFFEEATYEEVARALGCRVAQAHVILHRSIKRLGRAIVRRMAAHHDAGGCARALEGMAGLTDPVADHGPGACERCRPVLDELAALRGLGVVPVPAWLARALAEVAVRAPAVTEPANAIAAAIAALGVGIASLFTSTPAPALPVGASPAIVRQADERAGVSVADVRIRRARASRPAPARDAVPPEPRQVASAGPATVQSDDRHTQAEVSEGDATTGVVVCEPLQPCPPPPSEDDR